MANGLLFIHKAIMREAHEIEHAVARMEDPAAVLKKLTFFEEIAHHHTDGEEEFFFPELEKKLPKVAVTYVFDHKDEKKLFATLKDAIGKAADDVHASHMARRTAIALVEHLDGHIRKENELVVPLIEELFTPEEHAAMVMKIQSKIPPQMMATVLPWLVNHLDPGERVELLSLMPPERKTMVMGMLKTALKPDVWATIEKA
jgi:hemerythrin-like domain-containing protein